MLNKVLNIGDKTKVVSNLNNGMKYNDFFVTNSMLELRGKIVEVVAKSIRDGQPVYKLKESSMFISWTPEMLEEVKPKSLTIRLTFNGTATVAKIENKQGIALCNSNIDLYDENEGIRISVCRALDVDPFKVEKPIVKTIEEYSTKEILEELVKKVN